MEIKIIILHAEAKNLRKSFCWVLGCVGIVGNEKAVTAAMNEAVLTLDRNKL